MITQLIKHLLGTLVFFSSIFLSAGRIDYWQGQIYVLIGLIMFTLNYTILRIDQDLMVERSKPKDDSKKWDKILLLILFVSTIFMYVVAGLDSGRYNWSPDFPWQLYMIGIILTIVGQLLFLIAQKQNKFFSSTVRIQKERDHVVYEKGLYKFVRHPAYLGSILQLIGFPLLFGSAWSLIPVCLSIILHIVRTNLEDKTLKDELNGYLEYSNKTKYKILPFIW